jgi:hypothetical protein
MAADGLLRTRLASANVGVFSTGVASDGAGLGELVDFFWKKPRIDFWFFADCDADAGCFFCEGRGVDISFPSTPRTMIAVRGVLKKSNVKVRDDQAVVTATILKERVRRAALVRVER